MNYKKSPIFYMGNKHKLIKHGLIDLFPQDIDTFIEPFCGSGVVSMNVKANKYILNDVDKNTFELLNIFKTNTSDEIIDHINKRVKEFDLNKESVDNRRKGITKDDVEKYKENYKVFCDFYNESEDRDALDLYTLTFFSFCHTFNFAKEKENNRFKFNSGKGNGCFSDTHYIKIIDGCDFFSNINVQLNKRGFKELLKKANTNDFIYLDPPYSNTNATYNSKNGDNDGWSIEKDYELFGELDTLNEKGVKFGMSNVYEHNEKTNQHLMDWVNKNNYKVHLFDGFGYSCIGRKKTKTIEVYVYNY